MKILTFLLICVVGFLLLFSCDKSCIKTKVKGKVLEFHTEKNVADAHVVFLGYASSEVLGETYSDENGNYELSYYADKDHRFTAVAYKEMYYSHFEQVHGDRKNNINLFLYPFAYLGYKIINDSLLPDNYIYSEIDNYERDGFRYIDCSSPYANPENCGDNVDAGIYNGYNMRIFHGYNLVEIYWRTSKDNVAWMGHGTTLWLPGNDTVFYTITY